MSSQDIINHGFIKPTVKPEEHVLGFSPTPQPILRPDGQWIDLVPVSEQQFTKSFDTFGCTVFGTLNCLEILKKQINLQEENFSDRFTYIASETRPPGNDPQVVAESIRKAGTVLESSLPFSQDISSLEEFVSIDDSKMGELIMEGLNWIKKYGFKHDWVFKEALPLPVKQAKLMEALTLSPIGISVRAWQMGEKGLYYKNPGEEDTHWCALVGYVKGSHWVVFDSYPNVQGSSIKLLEWDYDFGFAKRYFLNPNFNLHLEKGLNIDDNWFIKLLKTLINLFKKQ